MGPGQAGRAGGLVSKLGKMAKLSYTPDRGDFVHLDLSPSSGRELTGPHYALVLTNKSYSRATGLTACVPITSRIRGGPFEVVIPKGILPPKASVGEVESVVLADSLRQVDYRERSMALIARCPRDVL